MRDIVVPGESLTEEQADRLYEIADLIHAVARRLAAPADLRPGPCTPVEINVMRRIVERLRRGGSW